MTPPPLPAIDLIDSQLRVERIVWLFMLQRAERPAARKVLTEQIDPLLEQRWALMQQRDARGPQEAA